MAEPTRTNFLILRGVQPSDLLRIESNYLKSPTIEQFNFEANTYYTEMPKKFVNVESWIPMSNLKCWECDQIPISYPKFIPVNPEVDKDGNDICDVYGHFCEWNCAVRYAMKELAEQQQSWDTLQLIYLFESKFSGQKKVKIMPCPPKTLMKEYCGQSGLTTKQWRDELEALNKSYALGAYKMEHHREFIV